MNTHKVTLKYLKSDALVFEFEQALYLIADIFLVGYNGGSWTAKDFEKGFFFSTLSLCFRILPLHYMVNIFEV